MKNLQTFSEFVNENMVKIPMGEVRGSEIRVNAVGNKVYLVNFDEEMRDYISFIRPVIF